MERLSSEHILEISKTSEKTCEVLKAQVRNLNSTLTKLKSVLSQDKSIDPSSLYIYSQVKLKRKYFKNAKPSVSTPIPFISGTTCSSC